MIDAQTLTSLKPGDALEVEGFFPGLGPDPIVLTCKQHGPEGVGCRAEFDVRYLGVHMGLWVAIASPAGVRWEGLPL